MEEELNEKTEKIKAFNNLLADNEKLKREKNSHMKPRTIDIDIVFYDDLEVNKPNLKIPHYDWQNRSFFIEPLLEINCTQVKNKT